MYMSVRHGWSQCVSRLWEPLKASGQAVLQCSAFLISIILWKTISTGSGNKATISMGNHLRIYIHHFRMISPGNQRQCSSVASSGSKTCASSRRNWSISKVTFGLFDWQLAKSMSLFVYAIYIYTYILYIHIDIYIYVYACMYIYIWYYLMGIFGCFSILGKRNGPWHIKLSTMRFASPAMVTSHVTGLVEPWLFPIISCSNGLVLGVFATVNVYEM